MKTITAHSIILFNVSLFAILATIVLGCSRNPSNVVLKLQRVQTQTKGDIALDCQFVGLPKDENTVFRKKIIYTKTDDGWVSAPSWVAGGFKRDFRRMFTFSYMEGYEPQFSVIDESGEVEIVIPAGQRSVKVFEGTNADGQRVELYIGYGDPDEGGPE